MEKLKTKKLKNLKEMKGITLIALVITIIVLLILAGVTIATLTGENGILTRANNAKDVTDQSQLEEEVRLKVVEKEINNDNSIEKYLHEIEDVVIEKLAQDTYYVTRQNAGVTVSDDGEIMSGKIEIWDGTANEPTHKTDTEIHIYTCSELKWIEEQVNAGNSFSGYKIYCENNLDFGARQTDGDWETEANEQLQWTPIGNSRESMLEASFDGKNHTIKGIYVNAETNDNRESNMYNGIFGCSSTIKNLTIKNSYIKGASYTGGIVGFSKDGNVENCHNENTTVIMIEGNYRNVGGVVGALYSGEVKNCTNNGVVIGYGMYTEIGNVENATFVGGIVGYARVETKISNCLNNGNVEGSGQFSGGIIGQNNTSGEIRNCKNNGNVTSKMSIAGGIIGSLRPNSTLSNCSNTGTITGAEENVGGIAGQIDATVDETGVTQNIIEECYNSGLINGKRNIGGISGNTLGNGNITITKCYSKGKVNGTTGVGSIIGYQYNTTGVNILNNLYYLNTIGIGAINGIDDTNNYIMSTTENLSSYEKFIEWIENK